MADDQVKYSDLIADDGAIDALEKRLEDIRTQLKDLKGQAVVLGDSLKGIGSATESGRKTIRSAASETDKLSKAIRARQEAESKLAIEIARVKEETREANAMAKYQAQLADSAAGSYKALSAQYSINKIILNSMSGEERRATEEGRKLEAETKAIYEEMKRLQEATGKHQLNVGNYADATKGLRAQVMELTEEMVRLRMEGKENTSEYANLQKKAGELKDAFADAQQEVRNMASDTSTLDSVLGAMSATSGGFAAVTGAMQLFGAESEDVQEAQKTLQASIALVNGVTAVQNNLQHQSALMLGVSKVQTYALAKAEAYERLIKIQGTSATVGATVAQKAFNLVAKANPYVLLATALLSVVGALWAFSKVAKSVSRDMDEMRAKSIALKNVNDGAASSIGEMRAKYQQLQNEWKNLKASDIPEWLKQHKDDWSELGISIENASDAENIYVRNTSIVLDAIDRRARGIAAMKIATEKYEEAFRKQVEAEQGRNNRQTSFWSKVARGLAGAGMAEGTGVLTPEQQGFQDRSEQQAIDDLYKKRMEEVKKLQDEANYYITTWALPVAGTSSSGGNKTAELKTTVSDLLTMMRGLEDAIIENIDDEIERAEKEELARHKRFIEDREAELKLLSAEDPRRAVINQRIEEERETHDRKMLEIDEKHRQKIIKLREKEEEEAEKTQKENVQKRYAAINQEWETERTQLVEQNKSRKELVSAELDAEIARLNVMLELERSLNGERMSDEEKAKIKEWIKLLERLKESGNFRGIKLGSIFGKGASGLGGEKNKSGNYTSISDLLWPDLDSDQTSALNSVFDQAKEALNGWMDARKKAADQAKELADDEVSAAENALNREIELRNQGYANDVALKERELADAKERQKKAAELQKKAEKDALAVNTAMEASSMAVAIANLFKDFPLYAAIPLTAVLLGSFAAAKVQSFQAINSTKYREGGVMLLEGGSHQSGHDVNLGIGPDGSNLRAEGGEYFAVINKRNSRKYGSEIPAVVNALNSGMFEDRYIKTSDAVGLLPRIIRTDDGSTVDLSAVESGVGQLVKQGESRWSTEGEYRVMRYKNLTRRVRIS